MDKVGISIYILRPCILDHRAPAPPLLLL